MLVEIIGFVAFVLNVLGNALLVYKKRSGWVVWLVAITAWGIYAAVIWSLSLFANTVTFFSINCWGIYKWRKK